MQNKANLLKTNVTIVLVRDYENEHNWTLGENKPNQTQSVVPALTCGELVEPSRTACRQSKFTPAARTIASCPYQPQSPNKVDQNALICDYIFGYKRVFRLFCCFLQPY
jgi:hypothetical protein